MNLESVDTFLKQFMTCVLATVTEDGNPAAATVGFSHRDNFQILIGTNNKSFKYQNLKVNPSIAVVVGFEGAKTVQLEGTAEEITPTEAELRAHYEKVPGAERFRHQDGQTYFLITPSWLRYTDFTADNPIFETKEF